MASQEREETVMRQLTLASTLTALAILAAPAA